MSTNEQIGLGIDDAKEKAEELIKRTDIKDSPFTVIETEGKIFGTMGQYRVTEVMDSFEECKEELEKFSWNRVMQVIMLLNEQLNSNEIKVN